MGLGEILQVTSHRDDGGMSVGATSLPHHARKIGTIDLRELKLRHDNVKLHFTQCISHSFSAICNRDSSATKLFEQALHDETRHRVVFADKNIQRAEEWAILNIELRQATRALAATLDFEQGLGPRIFVVRRRR